MSNEKAPLITAWLAMIVAAVARNTNGSRNKSGAIRKNGFAAASGCPSSSAPCPK
jgi:hypothetical protein